MLKPYIKKKLNNYFKASIDQYLKYERSLEHWFYKWLDFQNNSYAKSYTPKNTYYEFGTGWGKTLTSFINAAKRFSHVNNSSLDNINICLFDSFKGLPFSNLEEDNHPSWSKGEFSYSKQHIIDIINKLNFPLNNVKFFEGFYEDSLNSKTLKLLKEVPPSIITIDTDYYSSTKDVLKFLPPILQSGTVFYFDDLFSFFLNEDYGQVKSIKEFNQQDYGKLYPLSENNYDGKCFVFSSNKWEHSK